MILEYCKLCILKFSPPLPLAVFFLCPPPSVLWLADGRTDGPCPVLWKGRKPPNAPPTCIIPYFPIPSPLPFTPDRSGTERNRYCQPTFPSVLPDGQTGQQDIACPFWPGPQGQPASQHPICPYMQPANNVRPSIVSFKSYSTVARLAVSCPIQRVRKRVHLPYHTCLPRTRTHAPSNTYQGHQKTRNTSKYAHSHYQLFHSLTHNCPCPPRLRVSITRVDNRSPPHPRPLLAVVTCLLLSSL
ncbi:hypothetical protein HOY80DRAFT_571992 [Tuber brumale]|nr:hypothetical protein HOY80DRAFT_571992 [Tuber brumale]